MTGVVILASLAGCGLLGVAYGLRSSRPSLDTVWASWQRPADVLRPGDAGRRTDLGRTAGLRRWVATGPAGTQRLATDAARELTDGRWAGHQSARSLRGALSVCEVDPERFASRLFVIAGAAALGPVVLWLALSVLGASLPFVPMVVVVCAGPPASVAVATADLFSKAQERRRHVRVVLGSFVDLVVLGLAGGVGIDGALHAAAQVTPDWAAQRMATALRTARDGGNPPWVALTTLGSELGVPELEELSTTVQLAGTEGTRIRQALVARGASLRRHEQAEAESAANAMTERLFLPGALLLLGFLVFIGYPAVHRILGGF